MNLITTLSFAILPLGDGDETPSIVPVLDGIQLTAMIEDFERSHGYEPLGGYAGLVPTAYKYGPLDLYFMGETNKENYDKTGYYLLGCSCGEVGCWPLTARISRIDNQVVWDQFCQPHRPTRDYSSFGPFTFDLNQYHRVVTELALKFPAN